MSAPPGTRVSTHPTRGRSLVASRPFHAGELIATFSHPLLALTDGPSMRTTCNYCLRVGSGPSGGPLLACAGCKATVYCDAACQRAHWKAVHKVECKMFARVRANAGRDWLPTPTRAVAQVLLLLKAGDKAARAAFGEGGTLEGNVEAFRREEAVWGDYELQAMAAVVYGGLLESEEMLATARAVLCKVGGLLVGGGVRGVLLTGLGRYKQTRSIGWTQIRVWRASFWMLGWPWSTIRACPTRLLGSTNGRPC